MLAMLGDVQKKQETPKPSRFEDNERRQVQNPNPGNIRAQPQLIEKYTVETPKDEIRAALVNDGLRHGKDRKSVEERVDATLKLAHSDLTIFKGLVQYLNWQDRMPNRLETPRVGPVPK